MNGNGQTIIVLASLLLLLATPGCKKKSSKDSKVVQGSADEASKESVAKVISQQSPQRKWKIGFSQCTVTEPWRVLFNHQLKEEAEKHSALIQLFVEDAQDRTEIQVAQMESFIVQGMDAILISPKEAAGLTAVVEKATMSGIPVIVLDRDVLTEDYACFIGADNLEIGKAAGEYAVKILGGPGQAEGGIVEIWGGMGSTPARERHDGFHAFVDQEDGIVMLVDRQDGDWKQDKAYTIMENALRAHEKIDLVYAHNDPMAYGAYLAAQDAGREKEMYFLGIDGIPEEGCTWVLNGELTATFLYPPPGAEGIRTAIQILKGKQVEKRITLLTDIVTRENAGQYVDPQF